MVEEEEDTRWSWVVKLGDKQLLDIIQYCEYERGAINMVSRRVNAREAEAEAKKAPAKAKGAKAVVATSGKGKSGKKSAAADDEMTPPV
jgi:hypothetical protein